MPCDTCNATTGTSMPIRKLKGQLCATPCLMLYIMVSSSNYTPRSVVITTTDPVDSNLMYAHTPHEHAHPPHVRGPPLPPPPHNLNRIDAHQQRHDTSRPGPRTAPHTHTRSAPTKHTRATRPSTCAATPPTHMLLRQAMACAWVGSDTHAPTTSTPITAAAGGDSRPCNVSPRRLVRGRAMVAAATYCGGVLRYMRCEGPPRLHSSRRP